MLCFTFVFPRIMTSCLPPPLPIYEPRRTATTTIPACVCLMLHGGGQFKAHRLQHLRIKQICIESSSGIRPSAPATSHSSQLNTLFSSRTPRPSTAALTIAQTKGKEKMCVFALRVAIPVLSHARVFSVVQYLKSPPFLVAFPPRLPPLPTAPPAARRFRKK